LSVTPAGSLRICKAIGDIFNGVNYSIEPGMQADQWGVAASNSERCTLERDVGRRWLCSSSLSLFSGLGLTHFISPSAFGKKIKPRKFVIQREVQSRGVRINAFSYAATRVALRSISFF